MPLFKKPACDWMLVGLGNPGAQYARTRHNMGFLALDLLEKQLGADKEKQRHQALCASAVWHGQKLLLVRPQTFMNASGLAVQQAASYYSFRRSGSSSCSMTSPSRSERSVSGQAAPPADTTASNRSFPRWGPTSSRA